MSHDAMRWGVVAMWGGLFALSAIWRCLSKNEYKKKELFDASIFFGIMLFLFTGLTIGIK